MFFKGFLHAEEETLPGDCRENCFSSLHHECKWWRGSPCTSALKAALLCCAAFQWKNDPHLFWQQGQLKQLLPSLLALHSSFSPPKHSLQQCHSNCFTGMKHWAWASNWDRLKITQQGREGAPSALPIQGSMQPWSQQLWEAGRKERAAKELLALEATNN